MASDNETRYGRYDPATDTYRWTFFHGNEMVVTRAWAEMKNRLLKLRNRPVQVKEVSDDK